MGHLADVASALSAGSLEDAERVLILAKPGASSDDRAALAPLELLLLLVQSRLAEFFCLLESLPVVLPECDVISSIQRHMMTGSTDRALVEIAEFRGRASNDATKALLDVLVTTVRDEAASAVEVSHARCSAVRLAELLRLENATQLTNWISTHRPQWSVVGDDICFPQTGAAQPTSQERMRGETLLQRTVAYAAEFERIV